MPPRKKQGFAVVGLGSIAQSSVLPAFANSAKARLVAVVSGDRRKASRLARQFNADAAYAMKDYAACLAHPEVSAVYIATPQGEHLGFATKAAQAGKHVICEKPLAATYDQARKMVAACRRHGVLLMTAYRKYYEPSALYLKKMIRDGTLGRIDVIHTAFSELYRPGVSPAWLLDASLAGGGPLMDLGVYCVNTSRWIVDENPVEVSAQAWRRDPVRFRSVEEGIAFRMNFASGLVVNAATTYGAAPSSFLNVQGTKGWASLAPAFPFDEERWITGKIQGRWFGRKFPVVDEFAPELDAFAEAVHTGKPPEPDGVQGLIDVAIIRAIYQSAKRAKSVAVRYP